MSQQRRVLEATLALLAHDAPLEPVYLTETLEQGDEVRAHQPERPGVEGV